MTNIYPSLLLLSHQAEDMKDVPMSHGESGTKDREMCSSVELLLNQVNTE